jgi:hypothetical protein
MGRAWGGRGWVGGAGTQIHGPKLESKPYFCSTFRADSESGLGSLPRGRQHFLGVGGGGDGMRCWGVGGAGREEKTEAKTVAKSDKQKQHVEI